jgi:hypothetical protein
LRLHESTLPFGAEPDSSLAKEGLKAHG